MNIAHITNSVDQNDHPRAIPYLSRAICSLGHDSSVHVRMGHDEARGMFELPFPSGRKDRVQRFVRRSRDRWIMRQYRHRDAAAYEAFMPAWSQYGNHLAGSLPACDILNLHFVSQMMDVKTFFPSVTTDTPVVWTLRDMNAFTGGCHFDASCGRFVEGCGVCPQLASRSMKDASSVSVHQKKDAYGRVAAGMLRLVAPSAWMAECARNSVAMSGLRVDVIPNGIDTDIFKPRDRAMAREVLGLPRDKNIICFIAQSASNRRKGFHLLREALVSVPSRERIFLVSVGAAGPTEPLPVDSTHFGIVARPGLLSLVYNSADALAIPSLQDNLPNTAIESLACGTPIVGFAAGGISEVVTSEQYGRLAPVGDTRALTRAIDELLSDDACGQEMRARCREHAVSRFSVILQAKRYIALYEEILSESHRR